MLKTIDRSDKLKEEPININCFGCLIIIGLWLLIIAIIVVIKLINNGA